MVLLVGCNLNDEARLRDMGQAYFPLRTGNFYVYDVEETRYLLGEPTDLAYELKLAVVDSFKNELGGYTYILHRSRRNSAANPWTYLNTLSVRVDSRELILSEGSTPFVQLRFPVARGLMWDANRYNTREADEFTITEVGSAYEVNGVTFTDCLVVDQEDNDDVIVFFDSRKEIYAHSLGLIYKDSTSLEYCTTNDCLGQQKVEQGVIYKQRIKQHGRE